MLAFVEVAFHFKFYKSSPYSGFEVGIFACCACIILLLGFAALGQIILGVPEREIHLARLRELKENIKVAENLKGIR